MRSRRSDPAAQQQQRTASTPPQHSSSMRPPPCTPPSASAPRCLSRRHAVAHLLHCADSTKATNSSLSLRENKFNRGNKSELSCNENVTKRINCTNKSKSLHKNHLQKLDVHVEIRRNFASCLLIIKQAYKPEPWHAHRSLKPLLIHKVFIALFLLL